VKTSLRRALLALVSSLLFACATIPPGTQPSETDPWEPMNRAVFAFNEVLDEYFLKPITSVYRFILPEIVRDGIYNVFGNYNDIYTALNNLLQGKPALAFNDFMRVMVNTIFGLGGLLDVATPAGLEKHKEDWGQTFGVWGIPAGPYVVLPFFGPSSVRDTFGTVADIKSDYLFTYVKDIGLRNSITALRVINARNTYYEAGSLLEGAAIDKYTFLRDSYIQRRAYQVNDGRTTDQEPLMPPYENPYE